MVPTDPLFTLSTNWTSKIQHQKAFIYGIDVSDTAIGEEIDIDKNSLTLTEHSPYIFVTVTVSVIVPFCGPHRAATYFYLESILELDLSGSLFRSFRSLFRCFTSSHSPPLSTQSSKVKQRPKSFI